MAMSGTTPPPPPAAGDTSRHHHPHRRATARGREATASLVGHRRPNHLVWAILTTLFCCLPLGIAAIVFSSQVNSKWNAGDIAGAQAASNKARQFSIWAAVAGVVLVILYIILLVAGLATLEFSTTTTG